MQRISFLVLAAITLTACTADFFNSLDRVGSFKWDPTIGIPIAASKFTIQDYVDVVSSDEISITQDKDGVVVFEYSGDDINSDLAEDMIVMPNQSYTTAPITVGAFEALNFPVSLTITKSNSFDFAVDTSEPDNLDSMIFKVGTLSININGDFPVSGQLDINFYPIKFNGTPLTRTYSWAYNPANPGQSFMDNIDLTSAMIDFTKSGTTTNDFSFDVTLTINYEGQPISDTNGITVNVAIDNPMFTIIYGKFAPREFDTDRNSVALGLLEKIEAVDFYLDDPQIDFNFKSSFGIPSKVQLTSFVAKNSSGDSLAFTGSIVTDGISVPGPSISEIGTYFETDVSINRDNSNIVNIISFLPTELSYQATGSVESTGSTVQQFVLDTSQVVGSYKIKLPLSGHVTNFSSSQTYDFNGSDLDQLNETKIIVHSVNGLPLTVSVKLVFLDANDNPLDSLFNDDNILEPGVLDVNGLVKTATDNVVEVLLTADQISRLSQAKKIMMQTILYTGLNGTENVKIRITDEVKVGVFVQTAVNF